jgi:hypothetical protein
MKVAHCLQEREREREGSLTESKEWYIINMLNTEVAEHHTWEGA